VARHTTSNLHPLAQLLCEDRRYKQEAYRFVHEGLRYAQEVLGLGAGRSKKGMRHVTGQDLCHAMRQLAHEQYGMLAKLVLNSWGIHTTSDFGEIVYNLIKIGEMSKSRDDRRADFDDVYDFEQALTHDYVITKPREPQGV
jgi:uncharacterized repeat protein (TIGR04138 family)